MKYAKLVTYFWQIFPCMQSADRLKEEKTISWFWNLAFTSNLPHIPLRQTTSNPSHLSQIAFLARSISLPLSMFCRPTFAGGSFEALIHTAHLRETDATLFVFSFERNVFWARIPPLLSFSSSTTFSKSTHPQRKITERFQLRGRKRPGSVSHPPSNRVNKFLSHVSITISIDIKSWPTLSSGNRGAFSRPREGRSRQLFHSCLQGLGQGEAISGDHISGIENKMRKMYRRTETLDSQHHLLAHCSLPFSWEAFRYYHFLASRW